jgi:outer membrane protein
MKKIFLVLAICIAGNQLKAQQESHALYSLQYSISFGTDDLREFIEATSFRGVCIDYRKMVTDNLFAGLEFGWNVFYENVDHATWTEGTISITGTQYRYLSSFPMLVTFGYLKESSDFVSPYAGLGIGTIYNYTRFDIGIYEFTNDEWHFALKPEVGVILKPGSDIGIVINGKYYEGFKTSDSKAITYVSTNVGIMWLF